MVERFRRAADAGDASAMGICLKTMRNFIQPNAETNAKQNEEQSKRAFPGVTKYLAALGHAQGDNGVYRHVLQEGHRSCQSETNAAEMHKQAVDAGYASGIVTSGWGRDVSQARRNFICVTSEIPESPDVQSEICGKRHWARKK
jgi:rhamnogalacturonyl hydrolase YesR